jgi:hypothetical protein
MRGIGGRAAFEPAPLGRYGVSGGMDATCAQGKGDAQAPAMWPETPSRCRWAAGSAVVESAA